IIMNTADEVYTSFMTSFDTYYYKMMPFGLKNTGAAFRRVFTHVFKPQLGRNMEVYVDNIIVKSKQVKDYLRDLQEMFNRLRHYNMKLNPQKSTFGTSLGKFLGYFIS